MSASAVLAPVEVRERPAQYQGRHTRPSVPVAKAALLDTLESPGHYRGRHSPSLTPRHMPPDGDKVLVIVPAHNESEQVAATIESLLAQTMTPGRIVIACDNCTDDTVEIARRYPVTVMETVGNTARKSGAMNQAWLKYGQDAEFVLTMDADTTLLDHSLERMLESLVAQRSRAAVCARYWAKEGDGLVWRLQRLEYARYDDKREIRGWRVQVSSGAASLYRGSMLRAVVDSFDRTAPWDEHSLIEDYGLTLDLKTLGYTVRAAERAHVLTDTPDTFSSLWKQRQRWGRGGVDEVRKRGWTEATRRDVGTYGVFAFGMFVRLVFLAYIAILIIGPLGYSVSILGFIPLAFVWLDRVTSAWRLPGRDRTDMLLVCTLLVEDFYGLFLEACTLVAITKSFRSSRQSW